MDGPDILTGNPDVATVGFTWNVIPCRDLALETRLLAATREVDHETDAPRAWRAPDRRGGDNSAANRFNPDPNKLVTWGDQNWDEMQNCFIGVLIDPRLDPERIFQASGPSLLPRGPFGPTFAALTESK